MSDQWLRNYKSFPPNFVIDNKILDVSESAMENKKCFYSTLLQAAS